MILKDDEVTARRMSSIDICSTIRASTNRINLVNNLFNNFSKKDIKRTADQNKNIRNRLEELTSFSVEDRPDPGPVAQFLNKLSCQTGFYPRRSIQKTTTSQRL